MDSNEVNRQTGSGEFQGMLDITPLLNIDWTRVKLDHAVIGAAVNLYARWEAGSSRRN